MRRGWYTGALGGGLLLVVLAISAQVSVSPAGPVEPAVRTADSGAVDAFGRWRSSDAHTIFDTKLIGINDAPLFWDEQEESGGGCTASTPTAAKPYIDFTSTNVTACVFTRQTFRRFYYQPGKSQLILMTGVLELASGTLTGVERRIGLFDDDNGAFFESDAGTIGITTRSNDSGSPVDTTVTQANWDDPVLDNTGACGCTVDFDQAQIFVIDYQWLSVGRVRFGFELEGRIVYVHAVNAANTQTIPWSSTPNLPLRYQMVTTTSSGVATMRVICATVVSEGGSEDTGLVMYRSTSGAAVVTDTENEIFAVVGIRLKTDHLGAAVKILDAEIQIQTASEYLEWVLVFNPTVAGTFTYAALTNSSVETALGATANSVTGGTIIGGGFAASAGGTARFGASSGSIRSDLLLGAAIDGTVDEIVLAVRPVGGVSAMSVEGALTWREQL